MPTKGPQLLLTTSPFLKQREDTAFLMWQVNYSLVPVLLVAVWFFGIAALLLTSACIAGAALPEWFLGRKSERNTLRDGSGIITGALLALTLPPTTPLWMAFLGGVIAITLGKLIFGGIGSNIFNPALVGRAFLQAAFPAAMTTWMLPEPGASLPLHGRLLALPFLKPDVDVITTATPLASMKFDAASTPVADLLLGSTAGSLGETSTIVILLCGLYLAVRRVLNWRIPVSIFATVALLAAVMYAIDPSRFATPQFHLFSGGLMLGAVFMATDPVSSPITQRGCWIFGAGIGVLVIVIRVFGGLPEGVMYAILLMNAATPLINRTTQARIYGENRRRERSSP
ncbi:MAG: RnfABCDGE type electron transport complex subunit D [Rhodothermia bacterium]|nr:RnfABCDGE type electron transport complex subunit D [Rhodothermia bacterium]